jgi:surface antigen
MKWAGLLIAVSFSLVFGQTTDSAAGQTGNDAPGRSLLGMEQIADNGRHGKFKGPKWKHYQTYAYRDYRAFSWGHGGPPPWAPAHGYRRKHGQGPQSYAAPFGIGTGGCNKQVLGALLGGAAGGYIASEAVSGDARTPAIIGGSILGILVGGSIGRTMDEVDQNCVGQALEHAPDREEIVWNSPENGSRYQVTPTASYQGQDGQYCREYQATAEIGSQSRQTYGIACRQPDGSWRLVQ